ncbi:MAG: aminotransferase class III-fold pyridoxal phosphate-dependent enzyme [Xanthomonadales bacterium]|nr:aminotransferase class III-fold pyridoxal phosphate-dependent enzyme [Xanthomonadales bacterium]
MIQRRQRLLGSAYRLFYDEPLHVVRGEDVWLIDRDGRRYLDAYNNVPLLGHCRPEVVSAMSRQAGELNTHSRYLHEAILDYAEHLLGWFPDVLDRAVFGCSGSEANEFALRVARACTGKRGVLVTECAYHGTGFITSQLNGSFHGQRESWIATVPAPDFYRSNPESFLAGIDRAIEGLRRSGYGVAALLLDTAFTSDGIHLPPPEVFGAAVDKVRAAGGVFIADEVQAGFARLGEGLWGFQRAGLAPDLVTLGKPIGNGHPLAATIVRHQHLDAFSRDAHYFNTFGGNPVSAVVGRMVLEVFEQEKLADNARSTGRYLHQQLAQLADRHVRIGDLRGAGLMAALELVDGNAPDQAAAHQVVNAMRQRGVLISSEGPSDNVLKIRPPLTFRETHVDQLVAVLGECLALISSP